MRRYIAVFIVICAFMTLFLSAAYSEDRSVTVKGKKGTDTASVNARYHALIIGSNNYKYLPKLKTAIADTTGIEMVFVKGGCYQMGDTFGDDGSDEKPVHEVCVDDFYMGKYEVTQGQWKAVMGNNPSYFKDCGDNCPVESVSWNDIQEFINKLNQKTTPSIPLNKGGQSGMYRLPTEAEWEYAAKSVSGGGGKNEKYAGTSNESELGKYAWYGKNSGGKTHPVGTKQPNGLGICDMMGNVWEWTNDWYDKDYYNNSPKNNPQGTNSGQSRVLRGGSWYDLPQYVRASNRGRVLPTARYDNNGFRLTVSAR